MKQRDRVQMTAAQTADFLAADRKIQLATGNIAAGRAETGMNDPVR